MLYFILVHYIILQYIILYYYILAHVLLLKSGWLYNTESPSVESRMSPGEKQEVAASACFRTQYTMISAVRDAHELGRWHMVEPVGTRVSGVTWTCFCQLMLKSSDRRCLLVQWASMTCGDAPRVAKVGMLFLTLLKKSNKLLVFMNIRRLGPLS